MASIEHTWPQNVAVAESTAFGMFSPGQQISRYMTGPRLTRTWAEYPLRSYSAKFTHLNESKLAEWDAFLYNINFGSQCFWFPENIEMAHQQLVLGPLADGTQSTFVVPCQDADNVVVFQDGLKMGGDAYTIHPASNLLTDAQANAVGGTTGMEAYGTTAYDQETAPVVDGNTVHWVKPASAVANVGCNTTDAALPAVDPDQEYTVMAAFYTQGTCHVLCEFLESDKSTAAGSMTQSDSCTWGEWTIITATGTSGASAAYARVTCYRSTAASYAMYIGAIGLNPGDLERWFLPSSAPSAIEFASGDEPAARARVTMYAEGARVSRCRFSQSNHTWGMYSPGRGKPGNIRFTEEMEI